MDTFRAVRTPRQRALFALRVQFLEACQWRKPRERGDGAYIGWLSGASHVPRSSWVRHFPEIRVVGILGSVVEGVRDVDFWEPWESSLFIR